MRAILAMVLFLQVPTSDSLREIAELRKRIAQPGFSQSLAARSRLAKLSASGDPKVASMAVDVLAEHRVLATKWLDSRSDGRIGRRVSVAIGPERVPPEEGQYLYYAPEVSTLTMIGADVTDVHIKYLDGLPHLAVLDTDKTAIAGVGLAQLDLPMLSILHLGRSAVVDDSIIPMTFPQLTVLDLSFTHITDRCIREMRCTNIESLWLQGTAVSGRGLCSLGRFPKLAEVRVDLDDLDEKVVESMNQNRTLHVVYVYHAEVDRERAEKTRTNITIAGRKVVLRRVVE